MNGFWTATQIDEGEDLAVQGRILDCYGQQSISDEEVEAVVAALKSPFLKQESCVGQFERRLGEQVDAPHAVACSSGTAALHLTLAALGVGPGDEVITTPVTFLASVNCVVYCQGKPVFADIDPYTRNLSPDTVEAAITPRTVGIVAVHFGGLPSDLADLREIADRYGLWLVEDACQALGGTYREHPVGDCAYSCAAAFSFPPVKAIRMGEGGAVTTRNVDLAEKIRMLCSDGTTKDPARLVQRSEPWYYEMQMLGFNYRIGDLQCALGCSQLDRFETWAQRRDALARRYDILLEGRPWVRISPRLPDRESSHHLYAVEIDFEGVGVARSEVMNRLRSDGIGTQVHTIPVVNQPYYRDRYGTRREDYPAAQAYYEKALSLPLFPQMCEENVDRVVDALEGAIGK